MHFRETHQETMTRSRGGSGHGTMVLVKKIWPDARG